MRIGHASGGDPTYTPGDQTGREVCVREWYGGLRFIGVGMSLAYLVLDTMLIMRK